MKRIRLMSGVVVMMVMLVLIVPSLVADTWENMTGGIKELDSQAIAVDPNYSNIIFVGASNRLYKSVDGGENWQDLFTVYGNGKVNFITIDERDPKTVYIATSNGLFKTINGGDSWRRIFKGIDKGEKEIIAINIYPFDSNIIYAGTKEGLFISKDGGENWRKFSSGISNVGINYIASSANRLGALYIVTTRGVFSSSDMGKHWGRVFITAHEDIETEEDDYDSEIEEIEESIRKVNCIAISSSDSEKIYLGTQNGVFVSDDTGRNWQKMSSAGLVNKHIKSLVIPKTEQSIIYAGTDEGVFNFDSQNKIWQGFSAGMTAKEIRMLAMDRKEENLWAVGDGGVFKIASQDRNATAEAGNPLAAFTNEPTIREIQKEAIKYAEVAPEKIQGWRNGAKFRSLLPELSVGYDKTVTYDSGSNAYYIGPHDWGVDFKWDLADLIWNPYQKDIDVRSRLMVQLRDDVLDEVTHLYYERRRLQTELVMSPPKDTKTKLDKELRLQELTASIDALTDGYLSRRLNEQKEK